MTRALIVAPTPQQVHPSVKGHALPWQKGKSRSSPGSRLQEGCMLQRLHQQSFLLVCVLTLYPAYHPSHPPVKSGCQRNQHVDLTSPLPYNLIIEASSNSSYFAGLKDPPCQRKCMHRSKSNYYMLNFQNLAVPK